MLKSVYLSFRKVKVQRVTIVEFEMYNRGGDGVGCLEVKVGANAAQLTSMIVAGPRELNNFFGFPKVKWLQYTGEVDKCTSY